VTITRDEDVAFTVYKFRDLEAITMADGDRRGVVVITGATGMLGSATARELARRGVDTVAVARDRTRGTSLLDELNRAGGRHRLVIGDLSEPESTRAVATTIRSEDERVAGLVHAAAVLLPQRQINSRDQELMFATNVLTRFLLTHELAVPLAAGSGRVVWATGPSPDRLNFDDLMATGDNFSGFRQIRATNAANLQLAFELARRGQNAGITSNAFHPGALQSQLMAGMPTMVRILTAPVGRSAEKAARALADLATSPLHAATTGAFYKLGKPVRPPEASLDVTSQGRLWLQLATLVGVDAADTIGAAR
jgi:NAD(P)-dependent dehydrogenase (short-subunit alcohol dehydrogenase family)